MGKEVVQRMDELIRQKSLAEHIVEDLERKIIDRTLQPGQRIVEEGLCKAFGVSRFPVREAFQILESRGFVIREPRKGISVARITPRRRRTSTASAPASTALPHCSPSGSERRSS
jgi:DNA-binding GntR family transcriptional regulator